MVELIFFVILVLSLAGIGVILFRSIPDLVKLSEPKVDFKKAMALKIKEKARTIPVVNKFSYELYLQKILSRVRVLTLKTDHKTSGWLEKLRQKKNQENNNDKYWEELKKAKDDK